MKPLTITSLDARASLELSGLCLEVDGALVEVRDANLVLAWDPDGCWIQELTGYHAGRSGGQRILDHRTWDWDEIETASPGFREAVLHALAELGVGVKLISHPRR